MADEKEDQKKKSDQKTEISAEELEKSLGIALEEIAKAKAKKAPPEPPEEEEDEEGEEDEDEEEYEASEEEPDFEALSKSLEKSVAEGSREASDILDGIPFVKSLVESLEKQIVELVKAIIYLSDKVEDVDGKMTKLGSKIEKSEKVNEIQAQLVKSVSENVRKIGEAPLPRKAALSQIDIMRKSEAGVDEKVTLTKSEALDKLTELHKSGKLTLMEVISTEARIQKGMEIPDRVRNLLN